MTLSQAIIERIIELQTDINITTNKLVTLSGLSQATVRDITYGVSKSPKINTLLHICEGFNITLKDFFDNPLFNNVIDEDEDI